MEVAKVKNFFLANFEDVANTPDFVTLPEVRIPVTLSVGSPYMFTSLIRNSPPPLGPP